MIATTGVARFARYAAPPNRLGYCGPDGYGDAEADGGERWTALRRTAHEFVGAYPYLELLADAADIDDPLADGPVEAYWIGNPIMERVAVSTFGRSLTDRFRARSGRRWRHMELAVPGALCNHAFHVFVVSPWVGLMRAGVVAEPLSIVDDCRVSWGTVTSLSGAGTAVVERTPLRWQNGRLVPGGVQFVEVTCDAVTVAEGDVVAIHWGQVCDVLTDVQLAWLRYATNSQLTLAASIGRPC